MNLGLSDKVAFIAGSSRGIGLAIARAFLYEKAKVVITGREVESLRTASISLKAEADPQRILAISGNMIDPSDISRALDETMATFGGIDVTIANIGSGVARSGWKLDQDDWRATLNFNFLGSMALANAALPYLTARGSGSLIFISSIAGCEAINAPVTYSAAKAALQSAAKSLSRLVGTQGVRVNTVAPGNVLFPGSTWEHKLTERREFFEQYIRSEVPLQRFGRLEEIADVVVFLASERASFVTGACLIVDGGQTRSF